MRELGNQPQELFCNRLTPLDLRGDAVHTVLSTYERTLCQRPIYCKEPWTC